MVYELRAYWLVYPRLLKTEREEKERQMLFKMYNPPACDEVCSSAVCLRSPSNNVWQPHSASAAESLFRLAFILCRRGFISISFDCFYHKKKVMDGMAAQTGVVQFGTRRPCHSLA